MNNEKIYNQLTPLTQSFIETEAAKRGVQQDENIASLIEIGTTATICHRNNKTDVHAAKESTFDVVVCPVCASELK